MNRYTAIIAIAFVAAIAPQTQAQYRIVPGSNGPVIVEGNSMPALGVRYNNYHPMPNYVQPQHYPSPGYQPMPSYPMSGGNIHVTPNRLLGYNSQTGGWNTQNQQIHDSAYDPMRESSKHNGSMRYVERPIYGANGSIVGYQKGHVWNHPHSGYEFGDLKNYTPNNHGGYNEQLQMKTINPFAK